MQKITPNLWFDGNAQEAVDFYLSVFPKSAIVSTAYYPQSDKEGLADFQQSLAGEVLTIEFELDGQVFTAINAGDEFRPNPSISFFVHFDARKDEAAKEHLDVMWHTLSEGGKTLMPLQEYPFSEYYGWVEDQYGVSWQLMFVSSSNENRPSIMPSLMFVGDLAGKAEEATDFYIETFRGSKRGVVGRYPEGSGADGGTLMYTDFCLGDTWFAAMDSAGEHNFRFTEGVSFAVTCKDQEEIDYFWEKLSHVPEAEQCGWCKDQYGLSWQIVPENMAECMKKENAFATVMKQKKIVIAEYEGY